MLQTSWFVKVIRSGARYEDGTLPPEVWREKAICPTLNAFDNSGESRAVVTIVHSIQDAREIDKKQNGLGISEAGAPAYTIDTISQQAVSLSTIVRRLTPVECEKLQGFPSGWTDGQSDSARYKQMGNAVTANVVEWIGGRL